MVSRLILRLFCDHASKTAKKHGIDVDVASTLQLEAEERASIFHIYYGFKTTEPYEVGWQRLRPIKKFFYGKAFCEPLLSEIIPDDVCDTILQSLADTSAKLILRRPEYVEKKKEYDAHINQIAIRIDGLKKQDPNWTNNAAILQLREEFKIANDEFHSTEIEIPFVPKGTTSFEEARIWCDLND